MDITIVLQQMIVLFLLMVVGFAISKLGLINAQANGYLTKLVLNVTLPATIITSVADGMGRIERSYLLYIFLIAIITHVVLGVIAEAAARLMRPPRRDRGVYSAMGMFGNVGFMGFPVLAAVFGQETVFYGAVFNIIFNILVFSLGLRMVSGGEGAAFSPKKLLNAPMVSSAVAILVFLLEIRFPVVIQDTLGYLGNVTTPVAMILLGSTLAGMELREIFNDWRVYVVTAVKLLIAPVCVYLALFRFVDDAVLLGVAVVLAGTPTATTITMLTIENGGNANLVGKGIFISTVLSVLTIPLLVTLLFA